MLWDACGNRLLIVVDPAEDESLEGSSHLARRCFEAEARVADGIAWFAPRDGWHRTAFFNPDGSREELCGNSLLVAAALLAELGPVSVRPLVYPSVEVRSGGGRFEASASLPLARVIRGDSVFDTGSPHLVIEHEDVGALDLAEIARPLVARRDVNVTLYSLSGSVARVRTFERGVNAETRACGTGALAVAFAVGREIEIRYPGGTYGASAVPSGQEVRWTFSTDATNVKRL